MFNIQTWERYQSRNQVYLLNYPLYFPCVKQLWVMSEDTAYANCCLTLWRAGWVRSHSDTAPGVAACPLALELRDRLLPLTPWTWHTKDKDTVRVKKGKPNKLNQPKLNYTRKKKANRQKQLRLEEKKICRMLITDRTKPRKTVQGQNKLSLKSMSHTYFRQSCKVLNPLLK